VHISHLSDMHAENILEGFSRKIESFHLRPEKKTSELVSAGLKKKIVPSPIVRM
jgi:hypothetical protein